MKRQYVEPFELGSVTGTIFKGNKFYAYGYKCYGKKDCQCNKCKLERKEITVDKFVKEKTK